MFALRILRRIGKYTLWLMLIAIALFATGVLWPTDQAQPIYTHGPLAIRSVSILDLVSGKVIHEQDIYIENDTIRAVDKQLVLPEHATEIDGSGLYAMPALWDMHAHIYKVAPLLDLPLYIAFGVTNVRDMTSCPKQADPFVPCPQDLRRWSKAAVNAEIVGPRVQGIASWLLNGPSIHERINDLPAFYGTANAQQAKTLARHYHGKVDALKVYDGIPRDAYFALSSEAKKLGLDVIGHRPHAVSAIEAAENQKSIEHARFILHESFIGSADLRARAEQGNWHEDRRAMLDHHQPEKAREIFAAMKANDTWYVPTHLTRRVDAYADDPLVLNDPALRFMHPLMKFQWLEDVNKTISEDPSPEARQTYKEFYEKGLELTAQAHRAGVKVLVGTDYIVAGITVHDELEELVSAGLSPLDALRAATLRPAEYFGLENEYGQLAEGMKADIILLEENPFLDIKHSQSINTVIFNGNYYHRQALDELENVVKRRARSWSVACKILWEFIKNPVGY